MADVQCETHVLVSSSELKGMVSEITNLKNQVPKVLAEVFDKASKVESLEKALESKCKEMEKLKVECQHLTAKVEVWMVECEKEKEDKLILRKKVAETRQHLAHQAEYCTAFGAAACTLLWRVSRSEDTVQTILNGAKVEEFFTLTSQTLDSFMKSMIEEGKRKNIDEEENQFVLAMAGTITNVAAASCGREYLASTSAGKIVLDVFLQLLMQMGVGQCIKLKTLILMALYNVTINCNGLKYIAEKNGVANLLCWLLQNESEADLRCQVLRLIQSLVVEPDTSNKLTADVKSLLCDGFLESLTTDRNADVREVAMEIRDDLKALQCDI